MAARGIPVGPFTYTAPGDLGFQRDTMLENELLLREKLAEPRSRAFTLPGSGFTYGRPNEKRIYTAADALRGWYGSFKTLGPRKPRVPDRDFATLNQCALSAGLVTSKEHSDYRANHDIRCKPKDLSKNVQKRFPPSMVFGIPSRPSTPIYEILEHKFQDRWLTKRYNQMEATRKGMETMSRVSSASSKKKYYMFYNNRAGKLRHFLDPVDEQPQWQMPRFVKSAKPHLETFRTSKAKKDAFEYSDLDQVSRKGTLGQGVYEAAKD